MKKYAYFVAVFVLFVSRVDAKCNLFSNYDNHLMYTCTGNSIDDLKSINENATSIRIIKMPLGYIPGFMFSKFVSNLTELTCIFCQLTGINKDAFRDLERLESLNLSNNILMYVRAAWFDSAYWLKFLNFYDNNISHIEDHAFSDLPSLEHLRLDGNRLRRVTTEWFGDNQLPLTNLILSDNKINSIAYGAFDGLPKLKILELENNQLTTADAGWFGAIVSLKILDVGGNKISRFDDLLFEKGLNLECLDVCKNKLNCTEIANIMRRQENFTFNIYGNRLIGCRRRLQKLAISRNIQLKIDITQSAVGQTGLVCEWMQPWY